MSLNNQLMLSINRQQLNIGYIRLGLITSSNPEDSTISVAIQPENVSTGPIPYCTNYIGWFAPPVPGQQALVFFQEGSKNVPIGGMVLYWNKDRPPSGLAAGEAIWKHSSGSYVYLNNDGKVIINGQVEIDITTPTLNITTQGNAGINAGSEVRVTAQTSVSVTAPLITLSDGTSIADALVQLSKLQAAFDAHMHSGVQGGTGNTGAPTSPLGNVGTSIIRGA